MLNLSGRPTTAKILFLLLGFLCAAGTLYHFVDWTIFLAFTSKFDPFYFFLAACAGLASLALRCLRLKRILFNNNTASYISVFQNLALGNFLNVTLPARAGDAFRIWWLNKNSKLSIPGTLFCIYVEKLCDLLLATAVLFLFIVFSTNEKTEWLALPIILFVVLSPLLLVFLVRVLGNIVTINEEQLGPKTFVFKLKSLFIKITAFCNEVMSNYNNVIVVQLSFLSFLITICELALIWSVCRSIGFNINATMLLAMFLGIIFANVLNLLPFQIGFFEAMVAGALLAGAAKSSNILEYSVAIHFILLILTAGLCLAASCAAFLQKKMNHLNSSSPYKRQ